ncbi:MAG: Superfamily II DNA and RNA helicases [uncultured Paraburkholderia sp.]|nr:MAG: Superfamily II DNA and RNA helicases [uncultured Paraburkholderia sp.]
MHDGIVHSGESIDLQISDVLSEVRFPVNKDALVDAAREAGASNEVLSMLDGLPEQDYADVDAVTRLIGGNLGPGLSA